MPDLISPTLEGIRLWTAYLGLLAAFVWLFCILVTMRLRGYFAFSIRLALAVHVAMMGCTAFAAWYTVTGDAAQVYAWSFGRLWLIIFSLITAALVISILLLIRWGYIRES